MSCARDRQRRDHSRARRQPGCRTSTGASASDVAFSTGILALAAAPDGGAIVLDGTALWRVGLNGNVRRIGPRLEGDAIESLADGSVLLGGRGNGELWRVWPDGRLERLRQRAEALEPLSGYSDAAPLGRLFAADLAVAPDGGWLAAEGKVVTYIAPTAPSRLAVGIDDATRASRLPLRVSFETTLPAHVTLEASVRGRRTGTVSVDVPAGRFTVPLAGAATRELTVITVTAERAAAVPPLARDRLGVLPGGVLPRSIVRWFRGEEADFERSIGALLPRWRCRRMSARRIDCAQFDKVCLLIGSYSLRSDGIVIGRSYGPSDGRCRFRAHPRWHNPRGAGIALPTAPV